MQQYKYQAKNKEGKLLKGRVEAANRHNAAAVLHKQSLVVVSLAEAQNDLLANFATSLQGVSQSDIVDFTRQLAIMINAGLPLIDALESLREQSKPALARILAEVVNDVRGGSTLSEALNKHPHLYSPFYLALVKSGETAGKLDLVLKKLAENLEKQRRFSATVKSAMIYPSVIMVVMVGMAFVMMTLVIPKLLVFFQDMKVELPLPTKILIAVSNFMAGFWWLVLLFLFGMVFGFRAFKKTAAGQHQVDRLWLKLPVIGNLAQKVMLTQLTRTLAMLVGTGVPIIEALQITAAAAENVVYREAILECAGEAAKGVPLAVTFEKYDFFPRIVPQMVAVGEETGKLHEVLEKVSANFEEESDLAIKGLTSAIEPLLIVLIGLAVGFMVIAIIMPIYNLTSQI